MPLLGNFVSQGFNMYQYGVGSGYEAKAGNN